MRGRPARNTARGSAPTRSASGRPASGHPVRCRFAPRDRRHGDTPPPSPRVQAGRTGPSTAGGCAPRAPHGRVGTVEVWTQVSRTLATRNVHWRRKVITGVTLRSRPQVYSRVLVPVSNSAPHTLAEVRLLHPPVGQQLLAGARSDDACRPRGRSLVRPATARPGRSARPAGSSCPRTAARDRRHDPLHHQRRQPHRRLVQHQQLGPAHHRPAHGQHLLLAAGERAGRLFAAAPPGSGTGRSAVAGPCDRASSLRAKAPSIRFSSTVIRGKIRRPSGECASPRRRSRVPAVRSIRLPSNSDLAGLRGAAARRSCAASWSCRRRWCRSG